MSDAHPPASRASWLQRVGRSVSWLLALLAIGIVGALAQPPMFLSTVHSRAWVSGQRLAGGWPRTIGPWLLTQERLPQPLENVARWIDPETGLPVTFPALADWPHDARNAALQSAYVAGHNTQVRWDWTAEERATHARSLRARVPDADWVRDLVENGEWIGFDERKVALIRSNGSLAAEVRGGRLLVTHRGHSAERRWNSLVVHSNAGERLLEVPCPGDPPATLLLLDRPGTHMTWVYDVETHTLLMALQFDEVLFPVGSGR